MTDMNHHACLCGLAGLKLHGVVTAELLTVPQFLRLSALESKKIQDLVRV